MVFAHHKNRPIEVIKAAIQFVPNLGQEIMNPSWNVQGRHIGVEELGNGIWRVYYRNVFLGYFNEKDIREKEKSIRLSTNLV